MEGVVKETGSMLRNVRRGELKVLDLFSGIGGFSLGLERAGMKTVAFCEIEEFPREVLKKHWPGVPIFKDVRDLNATDLPEAVDVICGGYPWQPFSQIGRKKGGRDVRHLWPEMFRLIRECRPSWVICENVVGHISLGLDQVLSDMEGEGYICRTFVILACAVNAPHRRDRVWIVAHHDRVMRSSAAIETKLNGEDVFQKPEQWEQLFFNNYGANNVEFRKEDEPMLWRDDDGVSGELDESRLKALGNAVVPQIPEIIGQAILATRGEMQ